MVDEGVKLNNAIIDTASKKNLGWWCDMTCECCIGVLYAISRFIVCYVGRIQQCNCCIATIMCQNGSIENVKAVIARTVVLLTYFIKES